MCLALVIAGCDYNRVIAGVQLDEYGRMIDGDPELASQLIGRRVVLRVQEHFAAGWTMRVVFDQEPVLDHPDLAERPDDITASVRARSTWRSRGYGWFFDQPLQVTVQAVQVSAGVTLDEDAAALTDRTPPGLEEAVRDVMHDYVLPDYWDALQINVQGSSLPPDQYARLAETWRRPLPRELSTGLR
jgi:hypothetical protein